MTGNGTLATKLKSLITKDPRTAVLLLEILGPPPGLTSVTPEIETRPTAQDK